jgi:thiamine pyrophosphate-dependent acetolactate synthase large subunit-like protein
MVDFAAWARAQGAWGRRLAHESELPEALQEALSQRGPALLDLVIDRSCPPPFLERIRRLAAQTGA